MTIAPIPIWRDQPFCPELLEAMAGAFHEVCVRLRLSEVDDQVTRLVAEKIIAGARSGEQDAARLCARALDEIENDPAFELYRLTGS
jgi:hypothetical protein